jgi:hypothetical protein
VSLASGTLADVRDGNSTVLTDHKHRVTSVADEKNATSVKKPSRRRALKLRGKDSNLDYWSQNPASYH